MSSSSLTPITQNPANTKVIIGMSGGVDSSVSALLLKKAGYQVEGLFMKNWEEDDGTEYCTAMADLKDAQDVCERIGIHLHTANFSAEYWDNVFEHFLAEYQAGRTPNPDILCNREIKFKAFLEYALDILGADMIATGHYAQVQHTPEQTLLLKGIDNNKDQTYFLHAVGANEIAKTLFPIGHMEKPEVRAIAEREGLITHNKKDSTGICFIGERRFKDFLQQYLPAQPGTIETLEGDEIGTHQGLMYHTIGQRQGLCIGGLKNYDESPWYVVDKDLTRNVLFVAQGKDHPALFHRRLVCRQVNWISKPTSTTFTCKAKVRYRQTEQSCSVSFSPKSSGVKSPCSDSKLSSNQLEYEVIFDEPQRAITPGQYIVFYQDQICLGGGVIEERHTI